MRTAKSLIRLGGCPGWSESSLGAHSFCWFCHVAAQILWMQTVIALSSVNDIRWTASSEFGTYRLCEQRRFRRACASAQSRQNLRYLLMQAVSQEEPSDRKPDPWPLWMAGHAQLKFVMTECSKTQIRLTGLRCNMWQQLVKLVLFVCLFCCFTVQSTLQVMLSAVSYPIHTIPWAGFLSG